MMQVEAFELPPKPPKPPRAKPLKRMHVYDAGESAGGTHDIIMWECHRCGYRSEWELEPSSLSEVKRGKACPRCN